MKVVDRHLVGEFLRPFAVAVATFLLLFLVVEFFENLSMFLKYEPSALVVLRFFAGRVPWMAAQVIPMATLLGTLLSLTVMARNGEITALRCGGVALRRLALPYLVCGVALAALTGLIHEVIAPRGFAYAQVVKHVEIKGRSPRSFLQTEDLWLRTGDRILHVDRVGETPRVLLGVSVGKVTDGRLVQRIDAAEARWEAGQWILGDAVVRTFRPDGSARTERAATLPYPLGQSPEDFTIERLNPDEASWTDLRRRIERDRRRGLDTRELEVGLWAKTSLPFVNVIMPLLALPFGIRGGRRGGTTLGIALAVGLGFSYWLVLALGLSLGKAGVLPPPLAAWTGNLVFAALGAYVLARAERAG